MILEKLYLSITNVIYDKTKWIDTRKRNTLLWVCLMIEVISTYIYQCDEYFGFVALASINSMIGVLCFAGIIVAGLDHRIESIRIKPWITYVMIVCGVAMFVSGIHHDISYSYMIMALFLFIAMPVFLIVWGDRQDIDRLFRITALVVSMLFVVFVAANLVLAPMGNDTYLTSGRYFGIAADPNGMAKIAVTAGFCVLYLLFDVKGSKRLLFLPIFIMAGIMICLTGSRTNLIAFAGVLFAAAIFFLKPYVMSSVKATHAVRILATAMVVIIIVSGIAFVLKNDDAGFPGGRFTQGISEDGSINLIAMSSSRVLIWQAYLEKTTFIGNSTDETIYLSYTGYNYDHAHNTVIELLYRSGFFAGISFLILELFCTAWLLKQIFGRRKNTSQEIFAVFAVIAFGVASLLDIVVLPFAKMTVFLFYLCMPVVFCKGTSGNENKEYKDGEERWITKKPTTNG